jgi:hypothetical protein
MRLSGISTEIDVPTDVLHEPPATALARDQGKVRPSSLPGKPTLFQRAFPFPVMMASLLVGGVFAIVRGFRVDPDMWWHIKIGDSILATHYWPTTDIYSFTVAGQPWLAYEWLGEVLLAWVNRIGGIRGLEVLLIALSSIIVLSLYGLGTLCSGNSKAGFVAASILLPLATVSFTLRPQMLGYLFLILTVIALERFRQGKRMALWFVPLMMLLWVNTHGSWIIGLGTIFVYWMSGLFDFRVGSLEAVRWTGDERRILAGVFLLSLMAVPITPYGARIAASPFEFAFSLPLNSAYISEWQPMPFNMFGGQLFLGILLAVIALQVVWQFKWRLEHLALFIAGVMMACLHVRFVLLFVPFFMQPLSAMLARWIPHYDASKDKFTLNAALAVGVGACVILFFPSRAELRRDAAGHFPVDALEYLNRNPAPEPMYNTYGFGGYLVWSRGPVHRVFIDGRGDVYERGGVFADYLHISRLEPGTLAVLDNYGIQSCLLQRGEPLATLLAASGWKRIYADSVATLFVRPKQPGSHS